MNTPKRLLRKTAAPLFAVLAFAANLVLPTGRVCLFAQTPPQVQGQHQDGRRVPPSLPAGMRETVSCQAAAGGPSRIAPSCSPAQPQAFASLDQANPQPEAADGVVLMMSKTWDSGTGTWQLGLSWSGGTSPYTISYSTDPSFQRGDRTLGMNASVTALTVTANSTAALECFAVTDAQGVSPAEQGLGYDPYPDIPQPTIQQDGLWWGDSVTLNSNYLDLIPQENYLGLAARETQANAVTDGGSGFATSATFTVPDDGRGAYAFLCTRGQAPRSAPFVQLYPRGIPSYSNIRAIIYAPPTGHIWVAADGKVDEIDIFQHAPVIVRSITTYAKPYLSRCTTDGRILVVDGVVGVGEIDQIDASSGAVGLYAHTTDTSNTPNFTRSILPVGIAADPDGSAAYVADATGGPGASTPVRFPAGNGSASTDNYGNWPYWNFPDPCGIDVGLTRQLYIGSADLWIGYVTAPGGSPQSTQTYLYGYVSVVHSSIVLDADVSTASYDRFFYSDVPWAMAYNQNAIASLAQSTGPKYLGADVIALNGKLDFEPLWEYSVRGNAPKPVILNNSGQGYPFPTSYQVADRLVQLSVYGWYNVPVHLRLIDPPDMSAYAPVGGWPAKGAPAVPPYEANDNDVWADSSNTDWGLSATYPGTLNKNLEIDVYPGSSNTATFYLKLPARYAGDNWQIEVRKKNPYGTLIANKIPSYSPMFTGWKRVYVERDKMFRRGGLLAEDYNHATANPKNRVRVWNWTNVHSGDHIVLFEADRAAESSGAEHATIKDPIVDGGDGKTVLLDLDLGLDGQGQPILLQQDCSASINPTTGAMDFAYGQSAAVGVINSADWAIFDTDPNQINGPGSAFYDADTRDIEQPYDDAFVEFIAPRDGMGAVPFLPQSWFDAAPADSRSLFSKIWFAHWTVDPSSATHCMENNYFHLIGASESSQALGFTTSISNTSYVFFQGIADHSYPSQFTAYCQEVTDHELTHQWDVNWCSCDLHDTNNAWCATSSNCATSGLLYTEACLMNMAAATPPVGDPAQLIDGINRLCTTDLLLGSSGCTNIGCPDESTRNAAQGYGAVRTMPDPW